MQLVVDVGNTETVIGLASGPTELVADWRVSSSVPRTADEMTALIRALLTGSGVDENRIVRGVVGSVVPSVNYVWSKTIKTITIDVASTSTNLSASTDYFYTLQLKAGSEFPDRRRWLHGEHR